MAECPNLLRELAVSELQTLLRSEPQLARAFKTLAAKAYHSRLKTFCREGVSYTNRRVARVRAALRALEAGQTSRPSAGLGGLIDDALRASRLRNRSGTAGTTVRPPNGVTSLNVAAAYDMVHAVRN